jgi:hypothetical protein
MKIQGPAVVVIVAIIVAIVSGSIGYIAKPAGETTTVTTTMTTTVTTMTTPSGAADLSMYSFEDDANGWTYQTWTDSQAITSVDHDTTKAYLGNGSIRCAVDLVPGDANRSKGEAIVDMRYYPPPNAETPAPYDLSNATITVAVWLPESVEGSSSAPNGIQVLLKDENWYGAYSHWMNIGTSIPTGTWYQISINAPAEQWSWIDSGFDPTHVIMVGVKIGANEGPGALGFTGDIWIDSFDW